MKTRNRTQNGVGKNPEWMDADPSKEIDEEMTRLILFGTIVHKWIPKKLKDGSTKLYGAYGYHVIKNPKDSKKQIWKYMGKIGSDKFNHALEILKTHKTLDQGDDQ